MQIAQNDQHASPLLPEGTHQSTSRNVTTKMNFELLSVKDRQFVNTTLTCQNFLPEVFNLTAYGSDRTETRYDNPSSHAQSITLF